MPFFPDIFPFWFFASCATRSPKWIQGDHKHISAIHVLQSLKLCGAEGFASVGMFEKGFPPIGLGWVLEKKQLRFKFLDFLEKLPWFDDNFPIKTFVQSKFHIDIRHPQCNNRQLQQIQRQRPNRPKREPYASGNWWQYHLERHHRCAAFMGGSTTHGLIHPSKSSWPQSISINQ